MSRLRHKRTSSTPWSRRAKRAQSFGEDGFTLIELVISSLILPIVVGAIAVVLVSLLSLSGSASTHLSDSSDAQTVSAFYEQDVQSAVEITTSSTASQCGPGVQLLGLEWNLNQQATYETVVSYTVIPGSGSTHELLREYCSAGTSATATSSTVVSTDVSPTSATPTPTTPIQSPPTIAPSTLTPSPTAGWVAAAGATGVTFAITEPGNGSSYSYTLVATPKANSSSGDAAAISAPTSNCGFATAGTGTYASSLCFVDFHSFNFSNANTASSANCETATAHIVNTPYTLSFCLNWTGGLTLYAHDFPTYSAAPDSEAYLGDNGFYTGVPGDPAIYQEGNAGTDYVTFTNIKVLDSNGTPATNWEFVTGDAETTDQSESITWTSNQPLTLLDNSPSSAFGNSCTNTTGQSPLLTYTSTLNPPTYTVECASVVTSDKTGTVMLEANAPSTLNATLVGSGLEAIFIGLLLPCGQSQCG